MIEPFIKVYEKYPYNEKTFDFDDDKPKPKTA